MAGCGAGCAVCGGNTPACVDVGGGTMGCGCNADSQCGLAQSMDLARRRLQELSAVSSDLKAIAHAAADRSPLYSAHGAIVA